MPKVKQVVDGAGKPIGWMVDCPACETGHLFDQRWTFDGDTERPTFAPSMLVRTGHHAPSHKDGDPCWCTYNAEHPGQPAPFVCVVCHSFVEGGLIRFLADCTHALASQSVPLPDVDE